MEAEASARMKILDPNPPLLPFRFENLPSDRHDTLWNEIRTTYGLSLEEFSSLKNARCTTEGLANQGIGVSNFSLENASLPGQAGNLTHRQIFGQSCQTELTDGMSVWEVQALNVSGLTDCRQVYVREESTRLWTALERVQGGRRLFVNGPPGIGKSTEIFGWIQYQRSKGVSILYMHYSTDQGFLVLACNYDFMDSYEAIILERHLVDNLPHLIKKYNVSVIVCDGFREGHRVLVTLISQLLHIAKKKDGIVIYCTSFQLKRFINGEDWATGRFEFFTMESWTYEDYANALKLGVFTDLGVDAHELDERFYYGGGCVRLFLMPFPALEAFIRFSIDKITSMQMLQEGFVGQCSEVSVNSLFQLIAKKFIVVSQYTSRLLLQKYKGQFIVLAKQYLKHNPSFQGWIFEMEGMLLVENKALPICNHQRETPWNLHQHIQSFKDASDIDIGTLKPNTLLIPQKYNQGLFDMLLYSGQGELRAGNFTMAQMHFFKLNIAVPFLEKFKDSAGRCTLILDIIIPLKRASEYKVSFNHFSYVQRINKYDPKFHNKAKVSDLCNVLLMDRGAAQRCDGNAQNASEYAFADHDANCEAFVGQLSSLTLRSSVKESSGEADERAVLHHNKRARTEEEEEEGEGEVDEEDNDSGYPAEIYDEK